MRSGVQAQQELAAATIHNKSRDSEGVTRGLGEPKALGAAQNSTDNLPFWGCTAVEQRKSGRAALHYT